MKSGTARPPAGFTRRQVRQATIRRRTTGAGWGAGCSVYSWMIMVDDELLAVSMTSTRVGDGDLRVSVTMHTLGDGGLSSVTMHTSGDRDRGGGAGDDVTMHTFGERAGFRGCSPSLTTYTVVGDDVRLLLTTQKLGDRDSSFTTHTLGDGDLDDSVTMHTPGEGDRCSVELTMHTLGDGERAGRESPSTISTVVDELQRDILVTRRAENLVDCGRKGVPSCCGGG